MKERIHQYHCFIYKEGGHYHCFICGEGFIIIVSYIRKGVIIIVSYVEKGSLSLFHIWGRGGGGRGASSIADTPFSVKVWSGNTSILNLFWQNDYRLF